MTPRLIAKLIACLMPLTLFFFFFFFVSFFFFRPTFQTSSRDPRLPCFSCLVSLAYPLILIAVNFTSTVTVATPMTVSRLWSDVSASLSPSSIELSFTYSPFPTCATFFPVLPYNVTAFYSVPFPATVAPPPRFG